MRFVRPNVAWLAKSAGNMKALWLDVMKGLVRLPQVFVVLCKAICICADVQAAEPSGKSAGRLSRNKHLHPQGFTR